MSGPRRDMSALGPLALLACTALGLACVTGAPSEAPGDSTRPISLGPGELATDNGSPALEVVPLLEEDKVYARAARLTGPPAPEARARRGRFGVRLGSISTSNWEDGRTWDPAGLVGFYYRGPKLFTPRLAYEIGFDLVSLDGDAGDGGTVSAAVSFLRFDAILGRWNAEQRKPVAYALIGLGSGLEKATWDLTDEVVTRRAGVFDLGAGVAAANGSWDARLLLTGYAGSDNARGAVAAAVGFAF